jgi:UDP-2,3-diacylglucosamine hydrolase
MSGETVYLFADAHLGAPFAEAAEWERRCIRFLRSLPGRASALYVLGDLFDFWIEYRHCIRADYFAVAHELRTLVDAGIPVHYFAGNHDFAFGPFITNTLGITVYPDHHESMLQGKRVHLYHGDGLLRRDVGYRLLRKILRNRLNQSLYKLLLPPTLGIRLASFCSATSRKKREHAMTEAMISEYRRHAKTSLDSGNDVVFFAHTHKAELSRWAGKVYCNTGGWMRDYTYATMTDGEVRLWRYRDGGAPEELPATDRNAASSAS